MTPMCSDASRADSEPLLGTAAEVERWLLVEDCGPWGSEKLPLARLPLDVGRHLTERAHATGARLLLLRHVGGLECPPGRQVYLVDSRPGHEQVLHRRVAEDPELLALSLTGEEAGWEPLDGPLLLACTHGRHDRCCALRGRPVAQALHDRWPGRTWECSHLGGHRFAGNAVVLPGGWYLGRLDAESAVPAVEALLGGTVPLEHLRGRSSLPRPAQAAQAVAAARLGRSTVEDLQPVLVEPTGTGAWRVVLSGPGGPDVEVRVRRDASAPSRMLSCGQDPEPAPVFVVEDVDGPPA